MSQGLNMDVWSFYIPMSQRRDMGHPGVFTFPCLKCETWGTQSFCGWLVGVGLEFAEVVDDLGAGPVLGGDEFSAEDALAVDDVGFGDLDGAIEMVDALGGVADGE